MKVILDKILMGSDKMEKEVEIKAYKVEYHCDKCNECVKFDGVVTLSNPPKHQHSCKCGEIYLLDKLYPLIIYK